MADPALPYRPHRVQPPRPDRLFPREPVLRPRAFQHRRARRLHLDPRLSPDPDRRGTTPAGTYQPHRLLLARPLPRAGSHDRAAQP